MDHEGHGFGGNVRTSRDLSGMHGLRDTVTGTRHAGPLLAAHPEPFLGFSGQLQKISLAGQSLQTLLELTSASKLRPPRPCSHAGPYASHPVRPCAHRNQRLPAPQTLLTSCLGLILCFKTECYFFPQRCTGFEYLCY